MEKNHLSDQSPLSALSLGKIVDYAKHYDASLLQPVPRSLNRKTLPLDKVPAFKGVDIWNGYELSWLNMKGKPIVAILQVVVPFSSPNLIESKSFKLYLNSFNGSQFESVTQVKSVITADLSACAGEAIEVSIVLPHEFNCMDTAIDQGRCIDDIDITVDHYQPNPQLLKTHDSVITETVHSHLLKSNCLITNQPDWATIEIQYTGPQIDDAALLAYLISFRDHNEFHEQCVERIFCDIMLHCNPQSLSVFAKYTRRGGLDINPFRTTEHDLVNYKRHCRQ